MSLNIIYTINPKVNLDISYYATQKIRNDKPSLEPKINIRNKFLSNENIRHLTKQVTDYIISNNINIIGTNNSKRNIDPLITYDYVSKHLMLKMITRFNIDEYVNTNVDTFYLLSMMNNDFLHMVSKLLPSNTFRPNHSLVIANNEPILMPNVTPEHIQSLNLWKPYEVNIKNSHHRYGNKLPVWQTSMHTRNYDRDNEGLSSIKHSSLEQNCPAWY